MTSAVNVRSQLIGVIFIVISVIIQCDGQTNHGKVIDYKDFHSQTNTLTLVNVIAHGRVKLRWCDCDGY